MAKVYLVEQHLGSGLTIRRALKIHSPSEKATNKRAAVGESEGRNSFLQEIEAISSFAHQNLVNIIDAGLHQAIPYFVMEYIDGADLRDLLAPEKADYSRWKDRALKDPFLIIRMAQQICWPIRYLHSADFYHFDVAPKNVFLREVGEKPHLLVGDLGVGRRVPMSLSESTKTVYISGTKEYAPEQIRPYLNNRIALATLYKYAAYWDVYAIATVVQEIAAAYDLSSHPDVEATLLLCERAKNVDEAFSAQRLEIELERLLPAHVITAGVEELSTDALGKRQYINIPLYSAPLTRRVHAIANHPMFSRLQLSPQLFLIRSGFPGGVHSTFEHVIGSYALMIRCLTKLLSNPRFRVAFSKKEIEEALLAALLYRLYSFPLDRVFMSVLQGSGKAVDKRELFDLFFLTKSGNTSLQDVVRQRFGDADIGSVMTILFGRSEQMVPYQRMIASLVRSSIDVRVLDYLARDSHHTGIPAGVGIDIANIIENLTWTTQNECVGISRGGVFAVEHLLCARYWMFSRVYWNIQNRAIATMLRQVIYPMVSGDLQPFAFIRKLMYVDEARALDVLAGEFDTTSSRDADGSILELLRQSRPRLYQKVLERFAKNWSADKMERCIMRTQTPEQLQALGNRFFEIASLPPNVSRNSVLFDLTHEEPVKLGEDILVSVDGREGASEIALSEASDIVRILPQSFRESAVRLRVFCHPSIAEDEKLVKTIEEEAARFLDDEFK